MRNYAKYFKESDKLWERKKIGSKDIGSLHAYNNYTHKAISIFNLNKLKNQSHSCFVSILKEPFFPETIIFWQTYLKIRNKFLLKGLLVIIGRILEKVFRFYTLLNEKNNLKNNAIKEPFHNTKRPFYCTMENVFLFMT